MRNLTLFILLLFFTKFSFTQSLGISNDSDGSLKITKPDGTEYLRVKQSNGRVGIGTTSPSSELDVYNGTITLSRFGNSLPWPSLIGKRALQSSGLQAAVQNNTTLLFLGGRGYFGSPGSGDFSPSSRSAILFRSSETWTCLLYTSPSPRDATLSRMPSSA